MDTDNNCCGRNYNPRLGAYCPEWVWYINSMVIWGIYPSCDVSKILQGSGGEEEWRMEMLWFMKYLYSSTKQVITYSNG